MISGHVKKGKKALVETMTFEFNVLSPSRGIMVNKFRYNKQEIDMFEL